MVLTGTEPPKDYLERLNFNSIEAMQIQLSNWGLPKWLTHPDWATEKAKPSKPPPSEQKGRSSSPPEEVPDASVAAELFNEALGGLARAVEDLDDLSLVYQGKRYAGTYTFESASVFRRSDLSEREWQGICKLYGRDPNVESFYVYSSKHPVGASPYPPHDLVALIAMYALAGRPIESLLEVLHLKYSRADLEEIDKLFDDTKSQHSRRDGLLRTAQQFAAADCGWKVGKGAPPPLSHDEHWLACHITERREAGIADEKIHQDILESGRELSNKEFNRLADLGLKFPST
jgi:hypothetical protein